MLFSCSVCDYKSHFKSNVKTHIQNKNIKCFNQNPTIMNTQESISCLYCNVTCATKPSMKRHLKTCKSISSNLEKVIERKDEKIRQLEEQLSKITSITHITNNNNIINNNNITINLTPWNDPSLPGNVDKYYQQAMKKLFLSVPRLIELIHFNKDLPENHTITIKNARTKVAKVYDGKEWKTMDENKLIKQMIGDFENLMEDYAEEKPELKYTEQYNEIKERVGEEKMYKDLEKEVKNLIYDKRDMIKIK